MPRPSKGGSGDGDGGMTQASFDNLAEQAKEAALRSLERNVAPEWLDAAYAALVGVAQARDALTSDDVWECLEDVEPPHDPRAMANVLLRGKAEGIIRPTDRMIRSRRRSRHTARVMVWGSLIRGARSA